jgi:hypothetical protein
MQEHHVQKRKPDAEKIQIDLDQSAGGCLHEPFSYVMTVGVTPSHPDSLVK